VLIKGVTLASGDRVTIGESDHGQVRLMTTGPRSQSAPACAHLTHQETADVALELVMQLETKELISFQKAVLDVLERRGVASSPKGGSSSSS
jgi:hypothetical protein